MSRYLTPAQRSRLLRRRVVTLAVLAIVTLAMMLLIDWPVHRMVYVGWGLDHDAAREARRRIADRDWYEALRAIGYWPTWIAAGAAMLLAASATDGGRPSGTGPRDPLLGLRVILSAGLAGLVADLLKPTIGRLRPLRAQGPMDFLALGGFREAGEAVSFGLPSSHAAVAFGAAWAITLVAPRAGWVLLPLAFGCGLTRMLSGAHYLSDVLVGAAVAYGCARALRAGGWWGAARVAR